MRSRPSGDLVYMRCRASEGNHEDHPRHLPRLSWPRLHEVVLAPHQSCNPVQLAAAIQVDACIVNFLIQVVNVNIDSQWAKDVFDHVPVIEDGYLQFNDRPGLGIELNEEAAEAFAFEPIDRPVIIEPDGGIGLE